MLEFVKKLLGGNAKDQHMPVKETSTRSDDKSAPGIKTENIQSETMEFSSERSPKSTQPESVDKEQSAPTKAKIYNLIIVDESGSMSHLRDVTLSGVNETITTIKNAQKELSATQQHFLTLVTFDCRHGNIPPVREIISSEPISNVKEFHDYRPNGGTPLYDAMGLSLTNLYEKIKDDEEAIGSVTILTDGLENASHQWTAKSLHNLIDKLKELGWSFSYMGSAHNVKDVADLLSIDNAMEFSHDVTGARNTWYRESSSKMAYLRKMDRMFCERAVSGDAFTCEERRREMKNIASGYYEGRITSDRIDSLEENEIFVFGSNPEGMHTGGAAEMAYRRFGAIMGQGEGIQGHSYAIPTTCSVVETQRAIDRFIEYAKEHSDIRFLVTKIGCGVAGYTPNLMANMFVNAIEVENIYLPREFWEILGLKMNL